ncbi:hypothetical protein [Aquimarina latercula]|uniref:hypothetical protein n=1 Tax=Aquimarina latercula TaxID=987 RepID=UPI000424AB06|nr:hypothetical protein [Aquimarina latercula]
MADKTENPPIIVDTDGVNEIKVGADSKVAVVKVGDKKELHIDKTVKHHKPVKWVWIAAEYLEEAKKMALGQVFDKWGEWKSKNATESIDKFGIGKQYVLANAVNTKTSKKDLTEGTIYYFEPFVGEPTLDRGTYIATVDKPKILSAYFARYKDEFKYPGESGSSNVHTYKNTIKLYVLGHMLPDYTVGYHNFALFEVMIFDNEGNKVTIDKEKNEDKPLRYFQKYHPNTFSVNTMTELDFVIDEEWREESKHEKDTIKTYHAVIKTTIYSNEDAFTGEEVDKINDQYIVNANENPRNNNPLLRSTNKFKSVAPNLDTIGVKYTDEDEKASNSVYFKVLGMKFNSGRDVAYGKRHAAKYNTKDLGTYDTRKGTVLENQQVSFDVKYDTMDVILDKYEAKKNNMFVVVGDVEYSNKNIEPCKFSSIEISHKSRKDPFVLFDEDKKTSKVIDQTNLAFGIVAGDKKEKITITAKGLAIQNYQDEGLEKPECYGITTSNRSRKGRLERKKVKHKKEVEFKHNSSKDVFSMEKAYVLYPEGTPSETTGAETLDISGQQINYEHKDNSVELEVGYLYNKNYDNRVLNFLGHNNKYLKQHDIVKSLQNLWAFRYLLQVIKKEKLYQSYFVPVSTCRYPNQVVQLRIYPDIKWSINLNYNIKTPLYYDNSKGMLKHYDKAQAKGEEFPLLSDDPSKRIQKQKEASLKKKATTDKAIEDRKHKSKFSLHFECEAAGGNQIKLGSDFAEKIRVMLGPIIEMYELVDKVTGARKARKAENELKTKPARSSKLKGILSRLNRAPMTLTLHPPGIGTGLAIGYMPGEDSHIVGHQLDGFVKLDPIIGGDIRIDLLALAGKIPVYGKLVDALDLASWLLDWLSNGAVELSYKIDLTFYANLKLPKAAISYNFGTNEFDWSGSVEGTFGGKLEMNVELSVKIEKYKKIPQVNFEAGVEADCYFKITVDPTKKETLEVKFSGLLVKVYYKLSISSNRDKKKPKKKIDPIKLIPSITRSMPIKFD